MQPKITVALDLSDGQPPIICTSQREAEFFADIWRASQGDLDALARIRRARREDQSLLTVSDGV
jgi:hypothetical protein